MVSSTETVHGAGADRASVAFRPPLLLFLALLVGFGARWVAPLPLIWDVVTVPLGVLVVATSFGFFGWAVVTMQQGGASVPTSEPTDAVVTRGPYALSRNPIYVSMVLLQVGVGIWANSGWFFALAAGSAVLLWWGVISREERYLLHKFGDTYLNYTQRVRRWI